MLSFHQLKQCCSTAKSAEVAMPWGYIDQWLGFASPVDITGLDGFAGQHPRWVPIGPDFPTTNLLFGKFLKQGLNAGCLFSICSGCFFC